MSCWQQPDWTQFWDCSWAHLTEPVYIWFPFGLTYLVAVALGGVLGWLLFKIEQKFKLKPWQWIGDRCSDVTWFLWGRRRWERKVAAYEKQLGSAPAEDAAEERPE